jgi:hypothetical protein
VFLNDDMVPDPAHLEVHATEQRRLEDAGRPALVLGDSPWAVHAPDRVFDRLIRETSMVFFYDQMNRPGVRDDAQRDWGFRHAWLLNLSAPARLVRDAGGFTVFPSTYGYEDDELAFRLARRDVPVLYRPAARATHDHRYEPEAYLEREFKLGYAAWGFARVAPECAAAMFGRDVTSGEELEYSRAFTQRERRSAAALRSVFEGLASIPADAVAGPHAPALIGALYGQHLLLKRWMWRAGLLAASAGVSIDQVAWP